MRKKWIYFHANREKKEYIYSGIKFSEFIKFLQPKINNLLLLKGDYLGDKCENNFELIEGQRHIDLLVKENICEYGDFGFVDYTKGENIKRLSDEQIAEMLFMAHMYRPIGSPFFSTLHNRFAYLSHDDEFFCKVFCEDEEDILCVLNGKVLAMVKNRIELSVDCLDKIIQKELLQIAEKGLLIDFNSIKTQEKSFFIQIYAIGDFTDMDTIQNDFKVLTKDAILKKTLMYTNGLWNLC